MLKRLNDALPQLLVTILIYGAILCLGLIWFASNKIKFAIGLGIGIICAVAMAIHMAATIQDALSLNTEKAMKRKMAVTAGLRYVVLALVLFAMAYFNIGSIVPAVLGVLGLKISAYLQPLINKLLKKDKKEQEN